ncbi:glutathione S-transferase family protein [Sphingomonas sp.]|jgi:glutathione S-transferase|uniref:glutathione S-transferase family protein n=1 Tax=Sphingomonas sp. TaxID=28214 RepID=UPI002EDA8444
MLTLYGHPFSRAHRVMWMLKELGLPFEHVPIDFRGGATRTPAYLAINPNGRVPALVDDGLVLFESLSINLYLARKFAGALAPRDLVEEAHATQWSFWVATEVEKPLLLAAANLLLFPESGRDPAQATMACGKLDRPFRVIDSHLATRPFLLGDRFTVADLNVAAVMTLVPIAGVPITFYPALSRWLDICLQRPAAADWKPIAFTIPRPPTEAGVLAMFV